MGITLAVFGAAQGGRDGFLAVFAGVSYGLSRWILRERPQLRTAIEG